MNSRFAKLTLGILKWSALVGLLYMLRTTSFAKFCPPLLAGIAWFYAERRHASGDSPLSGPWAPVDSERAKALAILWPLWRIGFAANAFYLLANALTPQMSNWLLAATLAPWVIFTTLGFLSAAIHLLAGDLPTLESWVLRARHVVYLVIGFVPYGLSCLVSIACIPLIWLATRFQPERFRGYVRRMGQAGFKGILWYLDLIGFIHVDFLNQNTRLEGRLLVGNHISMFDIISVLAYVDKCGTFVKKKYTYIPFIAPMIRACGFIPIDLNDPMSLREALNEAKNALSRGETFVIWPEGTRSRDGSLGPFRSGVFRLALELGCDITPLLFTSSGPVFNNRGPLKPTNGRISYRVEVGVPIEVPQVAKITPGAVQKVKELVAAYFTERLGQGDIPKWMSRSPSVELSSMAEVVV